MQPNPEVRPVVSVIAYIIDNNQLLLVVLGWARLAMCRTETVSKLMVTRTDHSVKARPGAEYVTAVWLLGEMQ